MLVAPSPKNATATCVVPRSLRGPGRAVGHRQVRADDGVGPEHPVVGLGQVHRAALGLADAGGLLHQLGQAALRRGAAGDRVVVAAVGGEHVVVGPQRRARADRDRLVPGGQVGGALDQAAQEQVVRGLLGAADDGHLLVPAEQGGRGDRARPCCRLGHLAPARRGVQVRLRVAHRGQRAVDGPVALAGDQQLLGGELGDHLAPVGGDHDLLLDPGGRPAVAGGPVGLQREDHALLEHLRVVERDQPAEDRLLPDGQADAVAVLQRERRLLVGEAELLRGRPEPRRRRRWWCRASRSRSRRPCTRGSGCRRRASPARPTRPRSSGSSRCGSRGGCAGCRRTPGRRAGRSGRCRRAGAASSVRRRSRSRPRRTRCRGRRAPC